MVGAGRVAVFGAISVGTLVGGWRLTERQLAKNDQTPLQRAPLLGWPNEMVNAGQSGKSQVLLVDVIGKQGQINVFAGFTRGFGVVMVRRMD